MTTEDVCRHEASHAVAAALLGLTVRLVDTTTRHELTPGGGLCVIFGEVRHSGERIVDRESARTRMIVSLCGPLESESWEGVPLWPLSEDADTSDERNLAALADWLGYSEGDYNLVLRDAIELTLTREYQLLHTAVTGMLDYVPRVDADLFLRLHALAARRGLMDHLLLKAVATTTTDLGEFEAVISTSAIDREKDIVDPAAMVDALQAWNRPIPLDWNHSTNPEDIVGHVNPEVRQGGGRRGPGIRRGRPRHRPRPARLATDEVRDDRLQLRLPDPGRWVV